MPRYFGNFGSLTSNHIITDAGSVTDVTDRAARLLGVVNSITSTVNVDAVDRAARLLGITYGNLTQLQQDPDNNFLTVLPKAKSKTTIVKAASVANGTAIVHTVTTGKTFYCAYGSIDGTLETANQNGAAILEVDTAGNGVFRPIVSLKMINLVGTVTLISPTLPFTPAAPLPFTATTVFRVRGDSPGVEAFGSVVGWEE